MTYARVISTGSYLPAHRMSNYDLEKMVDTSHEWIMSRTGIENRHIADESESTCDLAEKAALAALEAADLDADSIDLIVMATTTADQVFPSSACLLQDRLGIKGFPAFDVQAVCAGFMYALDIAEKFVRTESATRALVIGAETFSRIIDWNDRSTCVLFGDGAGAIIVEASDTPGIHSTHLHADGQYKDLLSVPVGVSKNFNKVVNGSAFTQMQGGEVFRIAVKCMEKVAEEALEANGAHVDSVDWMIPHQANMRIITATAKRLGISMDKVIVTVDQHGNTSAASIPLAFDVAVRDGRIKPGDRVLIEGFGGGFTWGAAYLTY
ncbi:MAG: ketoacyl-ACP synthase III [Acidiferrobacterales bacterium]|nr:ketoacyl-ACP synthase III [Acidiferrobacterales bacterium]